MRVRIGSRVWVAPFVFDEAGLRVSDEKLRRTFFVEEVVGRYVKLRGFDGLVPMAACVEAHGEEET